MNELEHSARRVRIGDHLDVIRPPFKIKRSEYLADGTIPVVDQGAAFIGGYIDDEEKVLRAPLPVIIFGDHTCIFKYIDFPFAVGADGTQLIRPDEGFDIHYFYYALKTVPLEQSGYQRHFKYLKDADLEWKPLPVQKKIASILSSYDDLIENNTRRIKVLEEMAWVIYREWFVQFRCPRHVPVRRITSPLGPIPEGWEVQLVKDVITRQAPGRVYREADVTSEGTIPVIDQSTAEILGFHDNEPDHSATPDNPIAIFGDHTCKMQLLVEPFSVGPNVVVFAAKIDRPIAYVFQVVRSLVQTQEYKRHWTSLNAKEVIVADRATAQRFAELIRPSLQQAEALRHANGILRRTRDLLLPKLISGDIQLTTDGGFENAVSTDG